MSRSGGLLDTSALIGLEHGVADWTALPADLAISIVTVAELQVGIYAARDTETRARRIATLDSVSGFETFAIDADGATEWSRMRYRLSETKRRINVNDLWIASVALVHGLPVVTRDGDFGVLEDLGGPAVIRI